MLAHRAESKDCATQISIIFERKRERERGGESLIVGVIRDETLCTVRVDLRARNVLCRSRSGDGREVRYAERR